LPLDRRPAAAFVVTGVERAHSEVGVADFGDELVRVQVKTSTRMQSGRYVVQTCTRGGNQSWGGVTKRLDARRFDSLFVVLSDGRRWCIPAGDVDNRRGILIGGPNYERFEVVAGTPIAF